MRVDLHTHIVPPAWAWSPEQRLEDMDRLGLDALPRLNHGWKVRPEGPAAIPREPAEYARRLYFDSLTLNAENLRFLVARFGADRVMLGSDDPFDMGDPDPVGSLAAAGFDAPTRAHIEGATATTFLGLA